MSKVAVIGYASIDFPAVLDGFFAGDRTVMIRQRPADAFPRPGGCPLYVALPIAGQGISVSLVTWVGSDAHGELFVSWTRDGGVGVKGIATVDPGNTPVCFVIYQKDGSCGCLFDPGMLGRETLTATQEELIANAEMLCVTVGPPDIAREALSLISAECLVAWVMKNDPLSYPEDLRVALGERADWIFCNHQEREWVYKARAATAGRPRQVIVETAGGDAVTAQRGEKTVRVDVEPISFDDASGAGDTLAGGCLAAVIAGESDLRAVTAAGVNAAASLLRGRSHG
ncbi:carbohydrate kinase family protein [Candidatus Foliamicus sp.]